MLKMKTVPGPASYASGGFLVPFGEFQKVTRAIAQFDQMEADDMVYALRVGPEGNAVRIAVSRIDVTGTSPVSWSELPDATDLSARRFTVVAEGE